MMTKLSFSSLKYEGSVEIKLLVDIQNDWFEVTHMKDVSQVKSTGEYYKYIERLLNLRLFHCMKRRK